MLEFLALVLFSFILTFVLKIKLPTGVFEYDPSQPLGPRGGFGQVFLGKAANGDELAIKKLHVSAEDAVHRELRIADEFRGKSYVNVIAFIDSGEDAESGAYFVVMPKAERSLQVSIDNKEITDEVDIVRILLQIVSGLFELGQLVHRDLKPDNILFHQEAWKVADFGIARFAEEATANNTLKDCLSIYYAAPEQWRSERATQASDIYSLGCIGFCLLMGMPPFVTDPSEEHRSAAVPKFKCNDSRLRTLINMMLRKPPESRPTLLRVRDILTGIANNPQIKSNERGGSALAEAASKIAEKEQREMAQQKAEAEAIRKRAEKAETAFDILSENYLRLWDKIQTHAPNAIQKHFHEGFISKLGKASLEIDLQRRNRVKADSFPHSGWDVIAYSVFIVVQGVPEYRWASSLWFAKLNGQVDYRWYEVSYFNLRAPYKFEPWAADTLEEADFAALTTVSSHAIAFGPHPIDDEHEEEFHERCIWLLSKAAMGQLGRPIFMPFEWPPQL